MKNLFFTLLILVTSASAYAINDDESYDIAEIYERVELPSGSKVDTGYNIEKAEYLYTPIDLDYGRYSVEITRVGSNMYRICGTDIYVETRYCYEYATYDDAILVVESHHGYSKGELIFLD
jgi:hypothetical protein